MEALGEGQRSNVDIGELFAPTAAVSSVRLLTAMAREMDLDLRHFVMSRLSCNLIWRKTCSCVCLKVAGGCRGR